MPRTKIIKIDDFEIRIGALTLDQVEEYMSRAFLEGIDEEAKAEAYRTHQFETICNSLNNAAAASKKANEAAIDEWTPTRISGEMDLVIIDTIWPEILTFSGMKIVEKKLGEASPAPEASISTNSEAAS